MTRILLSGGAGFIGSNFVRYVLEGKDSFWHDYQFVVVDSLTYAGDIRRLPLNTAGDRLEFHKIDILDRTAMANLGSKIDGIINKPKKKTKTKPKAI
jgi:dTDP-glucose 4,6-dehydratase